MRLIPLVTLIIFTSLKGYCQNSITSLVTAKEIFRPYYKLTEAGSKVLYLPMDYGRPDFSNNQKEAIKRLENATIIRIDLVYSDYPAGADFSLLTKKRLEALQRISLSLLKEGETIKIHGGTYKLIGGNFVDITPG